MFELILKGGIIVSLKFKKQMSDRLITQSIITSLILSLLHCDKLDIVTNVSKICDNFSLVYPDTIDKGMNSCEARSHVVLVLRIPR